MKLTGVRALLLALPFAMVACAPVLGVVGGPTESVVLPNGEICGYAGGGATLAFDGQRLAWTCDVAETGPRGLFGAPTVLRETQVSWRLATTARRADGAGFELDRIDNVDARVARLELASGEVCALGAEAAMQADDGRRVHYTCGGGIVLVGGLSSDERGLLARRAVVTRRGDVPVLGREGVVRVRSVVLESIDVAATGAPLDATAAAPLAAVTPATAMGTAPAEAGPAPLLGTTWSLERIRFANGSELVPAEAGLYTLMLGPDGSVALRVDCNQAAGRFELDAERLFFAPFATTRAACPPGTIDQDYLVQLGSAATYEWADDQLTVITTEATQLHFVPLR